MDLKKYQINKRVLDDLTVRFLVNSKEFLCLQPEEYFFILEEAHWFATDFYKIKPIPLILFAEQILLHNQIELNLTAEYELFKKYKQSIKVFGSMIFSKDLSHVLLVQQIGSSKSITFPKGKKSKNETGMECAVRETYEEVGIDVKNKIVDLSVTVFDKITFYCVFNVDMAFNFQTKTRNEISRIFWFDLRKYKLVKDNPNFKIFYLAYSKIEKQIEEIRKNMFKFKMGPIMGCISGHSRMAD